MANIVPKLNLNRTPSIITNNSIVFAKNIRIDIDGSIHKDYGIESLQNINMFFHDNFLIQHQITIFILLYFIHTMLTIIINYFHNINSLWNTIYPIMRRVNR